MHAVEGDVGGRGLAGPGGAIGGGQNGAGVADGDEAAGAEGDIVQLRGGAGGARGPAGAVGGVKNGTGGAHGDEGGGFARFTLECRNHVGNPPAFAIRGDCGIWNPSANKFQQTPHRCGVGEVGEGVGQVVAAHRLVFCVGMVNAKLSNAEPPA